MDFINTKNFCSLKDIIKKMERQATYWKKMFASHISDERLISRICKEIPKFNNEKIKQLN